MVAAVSVPRTAVPAPLCLPFMGTCALSAAHLVSLPAHVLFCTGPPHSPHSRPEVGGQEHATAFPNSHPFPLLPSLPLPAGLLKVSLNPHPLDRTHCSPVLVTGSTERQGLPVCVLAPFSFMLPAAILQCVSSQRTSGFISGTEAAPRPGFDFHSFRHARPPGGLRP